MPGAILESVDGDVLGGRVNIRLGPMNLTYAGTATIAGRNNATRELRLEVIGSEQRGAGTARADVSIRTSPEENAARVFVDTELFLTGRPAQLGAGMVQGVAQRLFEEFADRLAADAQGGPAGDIESGAGRQDAIDLTPSFFLALAVAIGIAGVVGLIILWMRQVR
jgi:carbon monoxide dehydrogenase subunit G